MNAIARGGTVNWSEASVLITGGTGSFGNKFVELMLSRFRPRRLVVFSRDLKDPVPRHTASRADLVLYDPSHYPATILELLSVASLCVHFFSSAVYESVFLGVPSLCIAPSTDDMGLSPIWSRGLFNVRDGGSYNVPGASYFMELSHAFDALPRACLKDFPMDPISRGHFVRTFLGFDDTRSSERFLDLVEAQGERP